MANLSITCPIMILCVFFHFSTLSVNCLNNETDLQALLLFKKAIDFDPQGALSSWNETLHFCRWKGILCSKRQQNRVASIDLMSQGLVGSLSPHLGNLSFLRTIILQNNSFQGKIPEEIGKLRSLELIEFSNNSFGGGIPQNLSQCRNLFYLNLIDNNLTGTIIPELGSLSKLEALGLTRNRLSGTIPQSIGNLTSLVQLSLAECGLHGEIPRSLVRLQRLYLLNLVENRLTGEIPLGLYNISSINIFTVRTNRLQGTIPSDIGFTLPRLRTLDLGENNFAGSLPVSLSNSSLIEKINLSLNNFTGKIIDDFQRLSSLQYLIVSSNYLEGDINFISSMTNCTTLERISAFDNFLSGSLPDSIGNLSRNLDLLDIARNQIDGTIPPSIENLQGLSRLNMNHNDLEGSIPSSIGKLHKLQEIYFGANRLTNELPFSFGNLTLLNHLYLRQNKFYGNIPKSVSQCTHLIHLDFSHNNLTGLIPQEILVSLSSMVSFDLSHNILVGSVPSEVGSLRNLGYLDLSHNRLSGPIPSSLGKCETLQWLKLESNSLDGEIPDRLSALKGLLDLDLSENNLSGPIPLFLGNINLSNLNLSFNMFQGEVPTVGVFRNESAISLEGNSGLCGGIANLNLPHCSSTNSKKKHFSIVWKVLILVGGVGAMCLTIAGCLYIITHQRKTTQKIQSSVPSLGAEFLRLSYADLLKATSGFSKVNLIGIGSFGSVYKGILDDGKTLVAVKVLNLNIKGASRSFLSECSALRGIRHRNLLKILSICLSTDFQGTDFKALVYELMDNGSLERWLHQSSEEESRNLSMTQRLNIAIDIASALEYLHCGTDATIVHGDLKPSNILLDENMAAHLGDFGLAKIISSVISTQESSSTAIKGTIGYMPPEYGMSDMVSTPGDVYSYGIFLLEMFTNRRPTDDAISSHSILHDFVSGALPNQVMEVVDPFILHEHKHNMNSIIKNCLVSALGIGVACSKELPRDRMLMPDVVNELHKIKNAYMVQ